MVGDGESVRVAEARSGEAAEKQWARTVAHQCSGKFVHFGSIDRTPGRCVARTRRAAERNPEPETSDGRWNLACLNVASRAWRAPSPAQLVEPSAGLRANCVICSRAL